MERAQRVMPGGVNSPVRSFRGVGGVPPFFASASGPYLVDLDGNRYLDMVLAYGPLILGHLPRDVVESLQGQLTRAEALGGPSELEVELAEEVARRMPTVEMLRLTSSGTEAAMGAVRLARAVTGRDLILKFDGCYHGHADSLLAAAGSGVATLAIPGSPGVPAGTVADTLVARFNDLEGVAEIFSSQGERVAAVIVEPVAGNMGVVPPEPGFLEGLRALTSGHGSLLILDEVMTGFRVARGGAQERYGVTPDLTCLGKVIGGGLPVGAFGGRADLMGQLAPAGPVYQAGTLSGNPLAVTAGLATLRQLDSQLPYQRLEEMGAGLEEGMLAAARKLGVPLRVNRVGSMLTFFFSEGPVRDYAEARASDLARFSAVHRGLLERGVFWPPSQFEAAFLSLAHTDQDLGHLLEAFSAALSAAP
jgi:glutamate-1-semialdehyde 2,1-aminomutase